MDPTPTQDRALRSHAGGARVAFNWGLSRVKANLSQREAEKSYGVADADLTPYIDWSFYALRKAWNAAKDTVAPWWRENSKEAYATGLERLARALTNWSASRRGQRNGAKVGFPRFRSKHRAVPSVRFTTSPIRSDGATATLPVLGRIKLHEDVTARLAGARILSATVRFERGRWFVSFTVEQDVQRSAPTRLEGVIGIDLGIKTLAVLSDGTDRLATMELIESSLMANAASMGARLRSGLERAAAGASRVRDVRGVGLMIGVEFDTHETASAVQEECFRRGLLVLECGESTLRFSPPLVVDEVAVDAALRIFGDTLSLEQPATQA